MKKTFFFLLNGYNIKTNLNIKEEIIITVLIEIKGKGKYRRENKRSSMNISYQLLLF